MARVFPIRTLGGEAAENPIVWSELEKVCSQVFVQILAISSERCAVEVVCCYMCWSRNELASEILAARDSQSTNVGNIVTLIVASGILDWI